MLGQKEVCVLEGWEGWGERENWERKKHYMKKVGEAIHMLKQCREEAERVLRSQT